MWRRPPQVTALDHGGQRGRTLKELLNADQALITLGGVALGGLGKSEVALWVAHQWASCIKAQGRAALLCHGYLGRARQPERIQLPPRARLSEAARREALKRWGDEAVMAAWRAPEGVTVWAGGSWRERVDVSRSSGATHLICDGALYRGELSPTGQLCLFDPQLTPRLFPFGDLSRPVSHFPERVSWWAHGAQALQAPLPRPYGRCSPVIARSEYQNLSLLDPAGERHPSHVLRGRLVEPWLGTARPQRLLARLASLGATLLEPVRARDHRPYPAHAARAQLAPNVLRVCTYKDLPRIPVDVEVYVLEPSLHVEEERCA